MIGAFARMFGSGQTVTEVTEIDGNVEITAHAGVEETRVRADDGPPEAFVERVPSEGGDVIVVPFMEAFRAWLKKKRDDGAEAPENE